MNPQCRTRECRTRAALWVATALLPAVFAPPACAQGSGTGFAPPLEIAARITAWRQWRAAHPHVEALQQSLRGLTAIQQDPQTQLTKPQALAALAVFRVWSVPPSITDAQAQAISKKLTALLTPAQRRKYAAVIAGHGKPKQAGRPEDRFGFGSGGQHGFDRWRAVREGYSFPAPRDYNPLNSATIPFARVRPRVQEQLRELAVTLNAAAQ